VLRVRCERFVRFLPVRPGRTIDARCSNAGVLLTQVLYPGEA